MIKIGEKKLCSGCGACAAVCPKNCISFHPDAIGSLYAFVNGEECVDCGACEAVCPIQRSFSSESIGRRAYAAYAIDRDTRFRGSSGGIFETLAGWIIKQRGYVFASKFDDDLKLRMFEASTIDGVRQLTKSKYLQSDVAPSFPLIKERVYQGHKVMVCATPCQIAALKSYLGKDAESDSLFLVDFFCHGVPSQELFDKSIAYVEERDGIKITGYEFRSKIKNGATPHYYTLKYIQNGQEKQKTRLYLEDPFYLGFQKYITLRDSCYNCPYGSGDHAGDITVGDFHDVDKYIGGINRFDGVSTIIVNSDKGEILWEAVRDALNVHDIDIEQLYKDGQIYSGGTPEPANRARFYEDMERLPIGDIAEKWFNLKNEWKKAKYYQLPAPIRKRLKKLMGL